jgi:SAM-dependent methyltransferase
VAERYDGIRPDYPPELVAELIRLADLGRGDRVLEIGCGTGQLTVPLAAAGLCVTAVELGPALAAVAQRRLVPYPDARVTVGAFEDVPVAEAAFDLVVAATSFHWIDEAVRVEKSARALRPGGSLAVVDTHHVAGGSEEFFRDVQACYEAWDPSTPPGLRLPAADDLPTARRDLDGSPHLELPHLRRYVRDVRYTTAGYRTLLLTYSNHLALPVERRDGLLGCIESLIDGRFGGVVTKRYLFELRVARRARRAER